MTKRIEWTDEQIQDIVTSTQTINQLADKYDCSRISILRVRKKHRLDQKLHQVEELVNKVTEQQKIEFTVAFRAAAAMIKRAQDTNTREFLVEELKEFFDDLMSRV